MNTEQTFVELEREYDYPGGFLGDLRNGQFRTESYARFRSLLETLDFSDEEAIPKRLVALLWLIPSLMSWQRKRVLENGGDVAALDKAITEVTDVLLRVLGGP